MRGLATGLGVLRSASVQLHLARLAPLVTATTLAIGVAVLFSTGLGEAVDANIVDATSFRCITSMTPVRQFYVDNLRGDVAATVAAANSPTGAVYPPGSVIQLMPGEAMVKQDKGFNAATHDWEFFELDLQGRHADPQARLCRRGQSIRRQLLRLSHRGPSPVGSGVRERPRLCAHPCHPRDDRRTAADRSPV